MPVEVRRAETSDGLALLELRRLVLRETPFLLFEPDEFDKTADDEAARIERLNGRAHSLVVIAADGPAVVGTVTVVGEDLRRRRHSAMLAVSVARSHWGQGIAPRMLQFVQDWAPGAGIRRLELTVHTTNLQAIRVYLKAGFLFEGLRRNSLTVEGRPIDEYAMAWLGDA